ncbi:hypothetical protein FA09DRAFT_225092 [Tilletiopsis washingtonensis]|uniref:Uncharacterized protein n=1 Tax=Tilletiopsis washingtonensis TaxID=58919 RepID=A0A316ZC61_9BASI|nr:hypothetical protein FA09DRAFT_225092 [Tilletiopsis washingtonensis]PWN99290.1 hypothetical protein FA09DRAFT_225092 [Tilletiopsis washingtonensis]
MLLVRPRCCTSRVCTAQLSRQKQCADVSREYRFCAGSARTASLRHRIDKSRRQSPGCPCGCPGEGHCSTSVGRRHEECVGRSAWHRSGWGLRDGAPHGLRHAKWIGTQPVPMRQGTGFGWRRALGAAGTAQLGRRCTKLRTSCAPRRTLRRAAAGAAPMRICATASSCKLRRSEVGGALRRRRSPSMLACGTSAGRRRCLRHPMTQAASCLAVDDAASTSRTGTRECAHAHATS